MNLSFHIWKKCQLAFKFEIIFKAYRSANWHSAFICFFGKIHSKKIRLKKIAKIVKLSS